MLSRFQKESNSSNWRLLTQYSLSSALASRKPFVPKPSVNQPSIFASRCRASSFLSYLRKNPDVM